MNDYSFNPNSAPAHNAGSGGGGFGGAGGAGAGLAADHGQNNYRGWGPAPTSSQMEQIPSSSLNNHLGGYGTGGAAALGAAGSGYSGHENQIPRGSDEMMVGNNSRGSPDSVGAPIDYQASHDYYSPSGQEMYGGTHAAAAGGAAVMGAEATNNYRGQQYSPQSYEHHQPQPQYYNPQQQQPQQPQQAYYPPPQQHQDPNAFDFGQDHNEPAPATPAPRLQIQNVAARRDSPKIEHSSWPHHMNESSAGTPGVSQNF